MTFIILYAPCITPLYCDGYQACPFLDREAEVTEDDISSDDDDDDDGSDLDHLDGSFIDDATQLTQAPPTQPGYHCLSSCFDQEKD